MEILSLLLSGVGGGAGGGGGGGGRGGGVIVFDTLELRISFIQTLSD